MSPCLAPVVAWSESVGVVSLIDKGAVGLNEFLYRGPETAGKRGEVSDAKLFANRSALFANDAESAMIALL
jgi:hypothetical protein